MAPSISSTLSFAGDRNPPPDESQTAATRAQRVFCSCHWQPATKDGPPRPRKAKCPYGLLKCTAERYEAPLEVHQQHQGPLSHQTKRQPLRPQGMVRRGLGRTVHPNRGEKITHRDPDHIRWDASRMQEHIPAVQGNRAAGER